jgi:hypothetical protein
VPTAPPTTAPTCTFARREPDDAADDRATADLEYALLRVSGYPEPERLTADGIRFAAHHELVEANRQLSSTGDAARGINVSQFTIDGGTHRDNGSTAAGDRFDDSQLDIVPDISCRWLWSSEGSQ